MQSLRKSLLVLIFTVVLFTVGVAGSLGSIKVGTFTLLNNGKPNLNISNDTEDCTSQIPFALPGASGVISKKITYVNNHSGNLSVSFSKVTNTPGIDGKGDLAANTEIAAYIDEGSNGSWNTGDIGLRSDGTTYSYPTPLEYDTLNNYSGVKWNSVKSMSASAVTDLIIMWHIPITVGNKIQGDSVVFNNTFVIQDKVQ